MKHVRFFLHDYRLEVLVRPEARPDSDRVPRPGRCAEQIALTAAEIYTCGTVRNPMFQPVEVLRCELQHAHDGAHLAFAQSWQAGDGPIHDIWLRWAPGGRNLVTLDPCPLRDRDDDPDGRAPCTLPVGHVGLHSFEYATTDS